MSGRDDGPEIRVVAWERYSQSDDERELTVHYFTWTVNEPLGAEADEGLEDVRVTVRERWPGGIAVTLGSHRAATVHLAAPLGDRRVVDGATGQARPRGEPPPRRAEP